MPRTRLRRGWISPTLPSVGHPFATFLVLSIVVIVTPGPDTMLTIRNSLLGGSRGGVFTAIGVALGQMTWTLATSAGLAALLLASRPAFMAVKLAGALYLVYLGARALLRALWPGGASRSSNRGDRAPITDSESLRQGMWSNLGNPKMAVFFPSLLPQFVPKVESTFGTLLALGLIFCLLTLLWLSAYAIAVSRAGNLLRRRGVGRTVDAITGATLVGFGIRWAGERR
jgi:threonine/homoserine/homoserine lactone efflux protein